MNNKISFAISTLSVCLMCLSMAPLYATEEKPTNSSQSPTVASLSQEEIDAQNNASGATFATSKSALVDEWRDEVLKEFNISLGVDKKGRFCVFSKANVLRKPTDPEYGSAIVVAFNDAMMQAQQDMLMQRFGQLFVENIRETFSDTSTGAKIIGIDELEEVAKKNNGNNLFAKAARIIDKKLSLEEAKLDQELIKNGISPNELKGKPVELKKRLFFSTVVKSTMKRAMGEISGLTPLQTTVKKDKDGNTYVGVILMMSQKTVQVAKDISLGRVSLVNGKGRELDVMIPKTPDAWVGQLGTRFIYDYQGRPTIVSYGMGSYVPDGDDFIDSELEDDAWAEAIDNADAQIAEFVNGYMSAESDRFTGQEIEKSVKRELSPDSMTCDEIVKNLIKVSRSNAKSFAKMSMAGISTLKRQAVNLQSGQKMCYVIRTWTYDAHNAVKNLQKVNDDIPNGKLQEQHSKKTPQKEASYDGFKTNDIDDF